MESRHTSFGVAAGLAALSAVMMAVAMPGIDVPLIGWVALVPLLFALFTVDARRIYPVSVIFGVLFSAIVHRWYPDVVSPIWGYVLIFGVGLFYASVLRLGLWLTRRVPAPLAVLALPVTWAAIEFLKYIAPVIEDWWFVMLPASQWRFPPALQVLSVTGFPGLSLMILLVNLGLAVLVMNATGRKAVVSTRAALLAVIIPLGIIIAGYATIPAPHDTFKVAAVTDMIGQDPEIQAMGEDAGVLVDSPELSQRIFDVDAALTRSVADQDPAFVVWPENEFTDIDNAAMMDQLKALAAETGSYITADTTWNAPTGLHDTAVLIGPDGQEAVRRAKINIVPGEVKAGFSKGPHSYPVYASPFGKVGVAVCWDVHRLWIMRELARSGAQIILLPMDNDFNGTSSFPPFHAANAVFRAVENRLAFGLGTVSGASMVIDPYGRITAEAQINERSVVVGETFVVQADTIYQRFGDWFGWLLVIGFVAMLAMGLRSNRSGPD
ncbi:apolipoprotein N-acyltransferase [Profundibacter sp.]